MATSGRQACKEALKGRAESRNSAILRRYITPAAVAQPIVTTWSGADDMIDSFDASCNQSTDPIPRRAANKSLPLATPHATPASRQSRAPMPDPTLTADDPSKARRHLTCLSLRAAPPLQRCHLARAPVVSRARFVKCVWERRARIRRDRGPQAANFCDSRKVALRI
eukprot:scaffold434_cov186-Pinguiococcus_pyrenoidosus.AAC.101